MFISEAYAQSAAGGVAANPLFQYLPLVGIALIFYFLLWRPQQAQAKKQKEMLAALRRGDKIVTGGGIIATVSRIISDTELEAALNDTVKVRLVRSTIVSVVSKPEPAEAEKSSGTQG